MKITYIAEGSKSMGMGHVMHSATVANELKWRALDLKRDTVIIDSPHVDMVFAQSIKETGAKLVIFNNLSEANDIADVVVSPGTSLGFHNIRERKGGNVWFSGPKYKFLRSEFRGWQNSYRPVSVECIGVMMGGTDPNNLTERIITELKDFKVQAIRGHNVAMQMRRVDLMLVGCGLGFWESLAVGTPAIPFAFNERQKVRYESTFKLGELGRLKEMIERKEFALPDERYEIGQGLQEVIEEILR